MPSAPTDEKHVADLETRQRLLHNFFTMLNNRKLATLLVADLPGMQTAYNELWTSYFGHKTVHVGPRRDAEAAVADNAISFYLVLRRMHAILPPAVASDVLPPLDWAASPVRAQVMELLA